MRYFLNLFHMTISNFKLQYLNHFDKRTEKGRLNLVKSLKEQTLLRNLENINAIISEIIKCIEVITLSSGEEIHGENDLAKNYLYFIFIGECRGLKNNNEVALLPAGEFFGEFPILDPTTPYNITAQAYGDSCFGKISELDLDALGKKYPEIWLNMAQILAKRLRDQNDKFYSKPLNEVPRLFIGSSTESLKVAKCLKRLLKSEKLNPEIWNEKTFQKLGTSYLDRLEVAVDKFDFAIFIFNNDDDLKSRMNIEKTTRDNVLFELGMFLGRLSGKRTYILWPEDLDVRILSDFSGIIVAKYKSKTVDLEAALMPAATQILNSIEDENIAQQRI